MNVYKNATVYVCVVTAAYVRDYCTDIRLCSAPAIYFHYQSLYISISQLTMSLPSNYKQIAAPAFGGPQGGRK